MAQRAVVDAGVCAEQEHCDGARKGLRDDLRPGGFAVNRRGFELRVRDQNMNNAFSGSVVTGSSMSIFPFQVGHRVPRRR